MWYRPFRRQLGAAVAAVGALLVTSIGAAADDTVDPFDGSGVQPTTVSFGGADLLETDRTVPHWSGQTTDPVDGVTYQYNMVGVDPAGEGSSTVGVDIIPIDVNVAGMDFNGSDSVAGVLASPIFQNADYTSTRFVTNPRGQRLSVPPAYQELSAGNSGAQLLDATMRAEFNKIGTDYHLKLATPVVYDTVTINVAASKGVLFPSRGRTGVVVANVDMGWFQTRLQNLMGRLHLDPTRLAIFLTKDVFLHKNHDPLNCCGIGGHGAGHVTGGEGGPVGGNGNQPVQTFLWASWISPGWFGPSSWINQDISALSHEVIEWANDPFNTNTVQPWAPPASSPPPFKCDGDRLETGDPTINLGFSAGSNAVQQDPVPNWPNNLGPQPADGTYHIQDVVLLPWFMRLAPNDMSQPKQHSSDGRYTFMGRLNLLAWFQHPSPSCVS